MLRGLEELTYPFHDGTFTVTQCGRICFKGRKVNLSHVFAGQNVGVTQVGERIWLVTFMHYDLHGVRLPSLHGEFVRVRIEISLVALTKAR